MIFEAIQWILYDPAPLPAVVTSPSPDLANIASKQLPEDVLDISSIIATVISSLLFIYF
jgi:hypothetical protein